MSPVQLRKQDKYNAALRDETLTSAEYDKLVPLDKALQDREMAVWTAWEKREKLYSSRALYRQSGLVASYKRWAESKEVPELLDIEEFCYMVGYLNKLAKRRTIPEPSLLSFAHPLRPGDYEKIKTKVGRVYGTWQLTHLLSEVENANYKTFYIAKCIVCGHVVQRFSYSRIAQPCGACARLAKPAPDIRKTEYDDGTLVNKVTVWQVPGGVLVQPEQPENATACAVQVKRGEPAPWMKLELEVESDQLPKHLQKQEEPVKEMSEFDKAIMNLDIPGM
jgi:hypothetical protein